MGTADMPPDFFAASFMARQLQDAKSEIATLRAGIEKAGQEIDYWKTEAAGEMAKVAFRDKRIAEFESRLSEARKALETIKARVCGDAYPHWTSSGNITSNRMWIADACDAALDRLNTMKVESNG